jgi:hypothetical protein
MWMADQYLNNLNKEGCYKNMPLGFEEFKNVPEGSVAIVCANTLLAVFRVKFNPNTMKNWDRFINVFQDTILDA